MQNNDTWHLFQQAEHVLMKMGVSKLVEHTLVSVCMVSEPFHTTESAVSLDPRVRYGILCHDHVDIVVAR